MTSDRHWRQTSSPHRRKTTSLTPLLTGLVLLLCVTHTTESPHTPKNNHALLSSSSISSVAFQDLVEDSGSNKELLTDGLTRHERRERQSTSEADPIECNEESLQRVIEACKEAATPSMLSNDTGTSTNTPLRRSFCGQDCKLLLRDYGTACDHNKYLLNISGVCTHDSDVQCIFAVIIVIPGASTSCLPELGYAYHNISESEQSDDETPKCTLLGSFTTHVPYQIRRTDEGIVPYPPLVTPWTECSDYPDIVGHERITTTTMATTQLPTTTEAQPTTVPETETQGSGTPGRSQTDAMLSSQPGSTVGQSNTKNFLVLGLCVSVLQLMSL